MAAREFAVSLTDEIPYGEALDLPTIIAAAVRLLDAGGRENLSMRSLAAALGCSHTAVYRYVADKDELMVLAADAVQDDVDIVRGRGKWDVRLRALTRHGWNTCWRPHPWVADFILRNGASPKGERRLAAMKEIFYDAGFDEEGVAMMLLAQWSFVFGLLSLINAEWEREGDPVSHVGLERVFEFKLEAWIVGIRHAVSRRNKVV